MSDDYTPTTDEVRDCYATGVPCSEELRQRLERKFRDDYAEFDRWLAAHDAEVKAEALREAIENVDYAGLETYPANEVVLWLRARADEIERGGDRG